MCAEQPGPIQSTVVAGGTFHWQCFPPWPINPPWPAASFSLETCSSLSRVHTPSRCHQCSRTRIGTRRSGHSNQTYLVKMRRSAAHKQNNRTTTCAIDAARQPELSPTVGTTDSSTINTLVVSNTDVGSYMYPKIQKIL